MCPFCNKLWVINIFETIIKSNNYHELPIAGMTAFSEGFSNSLYSSKIFIQFMSIYRKTKLLCIYFSYGNMQRFDLSELSFILKH